jgi:class 3 adenylate cyclase
VVYTAARMEELAGAGEILVSGATRVRLDEDIAVRLVGARVLRGRTTPIDLYLVEG